MRKLIYLLCSILLFAAVGQAQNITAAEYFFDADPGSGNGTPLTITTPGNSVPFAANISTGSLANGFHLLAIRTKDENGKWGLFEQRGFYINPVAFDMTAITAAEYFFDTDPGVGNGTALTINTSGTTVSQNCILTVPLTVSQGQHLAVLRVKDLTGHWGLFDFGNINVSGVLPISLLRFSGHVQNQYVLLQWQTEDEINISHFEIEQSNDGITFAKINTKAANNTAGRNDYSLTDNTFWSTNTRFYRLKMIDIGGRFKYSNIIKLTLTTDSPLTIFPNPANDLITISGMAGNGEITITGMDGMLMLRQTVNGQSQTLDISRLAGGIYILQYENGGNTINQKLIIHH
jgi:hypothetical protein